MSFDVYVEGPGHEWHGNYTANMGAFFALVLNGTDSADPSKRSDSRDAIFREAHTDGLVTLDGMRAAEAAERVRAGLARVEAARREGLDLSKYDAPNKWGSVAGATEFLLWFADACDLAPNSRVRVSL